ncbi:MAG: glycerol-3-phosphate 1-O-acyltransferase PlsY [Gammaproteobacteria bacterium]
MLYIAWFAIAYLLGSVSSAIILCKLAGLPDPRTEGSKNPGATNVLRIGGKKLAAIVLFGDALKGLVAVLPVTLWGGSPLMVGITALCVFLGHVYPVFFQFQGGKGVATYIGALLGANPLLGVCGIGIWLTSAAITRYSSLSALLMAVIVPCVALYLNPISALPWTVMSGVLLYRHRGNITRLYKGEEPKMGAKK